MNRELISLLRDEEYSLLTSSQLRFFDDVNAAIDDKLHSADKYYLFDRDEQDIEVTSKISALEKNLGLIIKHLRGGRLARQNFTKTYPKWKRNRENCIVQLLEIAKSINSDRFNCNVSKLVGYCTSAVGGGVALISAVLIPFTLGLTTPLAIGGAALTAAGATTAVGTSVTEIALLKSKVDKAKDLVEKDKDYFGSISDWLNHASDLQEALSEVLDFDIIKDITEQVKKFVDDTIAITSKIQRMFCIKKRVTEIFNKFLQFTQLSLSDKDIANIISILVAVFLLLHNTKNRLIFDCASLTIRSIIGVGSLVKDSFDIFRLSEVIGGNAAIARSFSQAITRGAVAVVGIALDVVGIVLTSIDVHKGSLSPEAEKIAHAATSLREEADVLERVHKSLSSSTYQRMPKQCTTVF